MLRVEIPAASCKTASMSDARPAAPTAKTVGQAGGPDAAQAMTLFVMVVATLYFGREVLVPVTLALLLAFILAPLVELLRRIGLGRVPSVLLGVIVALGVVLAIGGVIGAQIAQLTTGLPRYVSTVETKIESVKSFTVGCITQLADRIGPASKSNAGGEPSAPASASSTSAPAPAQPAPPAATQSSSSPWSIAAGYLETVLSPLETFGIVFVVAVFALLQREDLRDRLIRLVGSDDLHRTTQAIDEGGRRLSKYFLTQLSINTMFGLVVGLGLLIIGVPNPVLWGILSALLRFVPYVGSFIAAVLPMGLAAAIVPGWSLVLWTLALYLVVEGVTGQIVEPMVYGHSTGLSPFSVVVAAIFWSWLWGPVGLILSTPLTLCLVVLGRHVKRLEFLDVMLGDQPALTPVESFYQRVLAGDADEAQDQAELLLKDHSLSTYYDEVALQGLRLAANDLDRGVLDRDQLERVKKTIKAVVHGLESHDDRPPAASGEHPEEGGAVKPDEEDELPAHPQPADLPDDDELPPDSWRAPSAVLCIAGRGPLDEAASAMLAQLLAKHGLGSRTVDHEAVSRDHIATLDVTGVAMACISYLEISGSPAHLRYLIRRLRQRLPSGAPILVGLWPAGEQSADERQQRAAVDAEYFTTSLADSVTACVQAALMKA